MHTLQHDPILPEGPFSRACTNLHLVTFKWDLWVCPWFLHSALGRGFLGGSQSFPVSLKEEDSGRQEKEGLCLRHLLSVPCRITSARLLSTQQPQMTPFSEPSPASTQDTSAAVCTSILPTSSSALLSHFLCVCTCECVRTCECQCVCVHVSVRMWGRCAHVCFSVWGSEDNLRGHPSRVPSAF